MSDASALIDLMYPFVAEGDPATTVDGVSRDEILDRVRAYVVSEMANAKLHREMDALAARLGLAPLPEKPLCISCGEPATEKAGKGGGSGSDLCARCWRDEFSDPGADHGE